MYASPVQKASVSRRGAAWAELARLDLPLLAAALGLMAASIYTLAMATQDDIPGSPLYYVIRQAILEGLRGAASAPGGTSAPVFKGFPIPVAGKTGTAEKGMGRPDQSWYIALAPYPNPRYVVVATFEHGGFGVERAAPAVRKIMSALFGVKDSGPSRGSTAGVNPFG